MMPEMKLWVPGYTHTGPDSEANPSIFYVSDEDFPEVRIEHNGRPYKLVLDTHWFERSDDELAGPCAACFEWYWDGDHHPARRPVSSTRSTQEGPVAT